MNRILRCSALFVASFVGLIAGGAINPDTPFFDDSLVFGHGQYIELRRFLFHGIATGLFSVVAARLLRLSAQTAFISVLAVGVLYALLMILRDARSLIADLSAYHFYLEPFFGFLIAALSVFGVTSLVPTRSDS